MFWNEREGEKRVNPVFFQHFAPFVVVAILSQDGPGYKPKFEASLLKGFESHW